MSISISSYYGESASSQANARLVTIDRKRFYFSYETLVAIEDPDAEELYISENQWGPTSGRHLNAIDGGSKEAKAKRLSASEFAEVEDRLKTNVYVA